MKFSGGSAYTLSPHITVAKLLSVSSWLAGTMQADVWEMRLVNLAQPRNTAAQSQNRAGFEQTPSAAGSQRFLYIAGWGGSCSCDNTERNLRALQLREPGLHEQQSSPACNDQGGRGPTA